MLNKMRRILKKPDLKSQTNPTIDDHFPNKKKIRKQ